ncbi:MAG: PD-(D/E)XK nuclease family protein [Acidobacteriota bacterium]|jgi:hypothetical protein|nr:PD-(D/E)XK nuclease family protein [Acidobacteriota bacterium]
MGKTPQLHASALGTLCMEQFRRRYIEREVIPPGIALLVGTGAHKSVDANMQSKIETGELLPDEAVKEAARDGFSTAWDEAGEVLLTPEEKFQGKDAVKGAAIDKSVRLAELHHREKAPHIAPIHAERPWSLSIPGYPMELVGRIDIQEAHTVRDTKTSGKTPTADMAERSLQLKAYALAVRTLDGAAPTKVALDYLVDLKSPKAVTIEHAPDGEDFRVVLARMEVIALAMESGVFMPVEPGHWCCGSEGKWCGYWSTCRYVRHPVSTGAI